MSKCVCDFMNTLNTSHTKSLKIILLSIINICIQLNAHVLNKIHNNMSDITFNIRKIPVILVLLIFLFIISIKLVEVIIL